MTMIYSVLDEQFEDELACAASLHKSPWRYLHPLSMHLWLYGHRRTESHHSQGMSFYFSQL